MKSVFQFLAALCLLMSPVVSVTAETTPPRKAIPAAPKDAKELAARYYRGDGTGYNVTIILSADGSYVSEWLGCLGKYGESVGTWALVDGKVTFTATKEKGMLKGHLTVLEVMNLDGAWILVPTAKKDREFYEKWGVSRHACFNKQEPKK